MSRIFLAVAAFLIFSFSTCAADWLPGFKESVDKAKKEKKDVLALVLSSDKAEGDLIKLAVAGEAFQAFLKERFVLDVVELPEPKEGENDPLRLICRLVYEYNAVHLPFFLVLDQEGRSYWAGPLERCDSATMILMLKHAQKTKLARDYYLMEAELGDDGAKRAHMLACALSVVGTSSPVSGYGEQISKILEDHPKDDCALVAHFKAVVKVEEIKNTLVKGDLEKVDALLDAFLKEPNQGVSPALIQKALFFGGNSLIERRRFEEAVKVFEKAVAMAPETNTAWVMSQCIERIKEALQPKDVVPEDEPEEEKLDGGGI